MKLKKSNDEVLRGPRAANMIEAMNKAVAIVKIELNTGFV
jgi:hypothetical protein